MHSTKLQKYGWVRVMGDITYYSSTTVSNLERLVFYVSRKRRWILLILISLQYSKVAGTVLRYLHLGRDKSAATVPVAPVVQLVTSKPSDVGT